MTIKKKTGNITWNSHADNKYGWNTMMNDKSRVAAYVAKLNEEGFESIATPPTGEPVEDITRIGVIYFWNSDYPPDDLSFGLKYADSKNSTAATQIIIFKNDGLGIKTSNAADATPAEISQFPDSIKTFLGIPTKSSTASSSTPAADDASTLQNFLAEHLGLYFDKVVGNYKKDALDDKILSPGVWGPASIAALAGFVAKIKERIPASRVKEFTGSDPDINIGTLTKDSSPADLQFAWVATHPAGQSGYAAATEIGFDTKITSGIFATAGTPLRKLYDMLALSPAPFVVVTTPIPAGAQIITSDVQTKNTVKFPTDFPDGAILGIGMEPKDSAQVYTSGGKLNTDVHGPVAQAVLAGTPDVTMQLVLANGTKYDVTGSIKIGESVTFGNPAIGTAAGASAPAREPAPDAKILSGESRLQMNTSPGVTAGGTQPGFTLENVYVTNSGALAMNSPQVILEKRTGGGGDVFELSISTATDAVILIPIIVKQPLKEAVEHWSETILSLTPAAATAADKGIPHVALKQITWGYEEHYRRFGLPDVGNIRLIAYEPSDSESYPRDVNVIPAAEALAVGRSAESKWDPIDYAIAMYIGSNSNLVGTRLYTSSQLNRVMNSFPDARFRNG